MSDSVDTFKVITANLLREGTIVYLISGDGPSAWTPDIHAATVFPADETEAPLDEATADSRVIGAYAAEIAGKSTPISARERIRADGPTIKYGEAALAPEEPDFSI
ncbi:MAG: DUF2849 domain-containing protein [Sphingomonadales bacterium]